MLLKYNAINNTIHHQNFKQLYGHLIIEYHGLELRGKYFSSCNTWGVGNSFQKLKIWGRVFDGAKMKKLDFQVYFG